jgi:LPXTG-motif cell wall-anchored protein
VLLGGSPIDITNTFDATSVTVSATLAGNDAASHAGDEFYFEIGCTFNGLPVGAPPDDPDRSSIFTLTGGSSHAVTELPVGGDCTVDEFFDQHATQVSPSTTQSATLGTTPTTLTFENAFDVTPVTVTEDITGDGAATYGLGQSYTPIVYCQWPDDEGDVTLPDGGRLTLNAANGFTGTVSAPYGSTCGVTQNRGTATDYTIPDPVLIGLGDDPVLTITSDYLLGTATVTKHVHGDLPAGAEYGFQVACTWTDGSQTPVQVPLNDNAASTFRLRGGDSTTVTVLSGSLCAITETDYGEATSTTFSVTGSDSTVRGRTVGLFIDHDVSTAVDVTNSKAASGGSGTGGGLANTGSDPWPAALIAAALVLLGAIAGFAARRRRRGAAG